tara:strand:- start:4745 stop:5743 length:999 start_codon:yes stop_codon:yes gene_type:complete
MNYKALYATEVNGKLEIGITNKQLDDKLNPDEVLIKVQYSSLNYKDAMALNGNMAKIMRRLPMSPGIDLSGTVEMSSSKNFNVGDEVLVTGFGMGEKFSGGYSQYVKIDSNYIVKKPNNISLRESMIIGTAGFTAMLAVDEIIESNFDKSKAKILISGSTGGVASISIALLSNMGYQISTLTSKKNQENYLKSIGSNEVISTQDFLQSNSKPLNSSKWMGAIDTLGGEILSSILASMNYGGIVISTGNALSNDLRTTVLPFILRKVKLIGIDSVYSQINYRHKIWESYSQLIPKDTLNKIVTEIYLKDLNSYAIKMLDGKLKGRVIINIKDS